MAIHNTAKATKTAAPALVKLELAFYKRYHRGGHLYDSDSIYEFTPEQADILLSEVEDGTDRPIWRKYRPKPTPQQVRINEENRRVVTATTDKIEEIEEAGRTEGRIDIGSDEEIAEILGAAGNETI